MRLDREGKPTKRPPGTYAPCVDKSSETGFGDGCLKGNAESHVEWLPEFDDALFFHESCKARGKFPDDPIVLSRAVRLEQAEKALERQRFARTISYEIVQIMLPHALWGGKE